MSGSKYRAGFIGCGNMGGTLASVCARAVGGGCVALYDPDTAKTAAIAASTGASVLGSAEEAVGSCEYVFLGVKPQIMKDLLHGIAGAAAKRPGVVFVSMAAGIETSLIKKETGRPGLRVIRIMPNMPCRSGEGMILCSPAAGVSEEEYASFLPLLDGAGRIARIPEKLIDAACALSGSGPAYVFMFIEALTDAGIECGLPSDIAKLLAAQTVLGSAKSVLDAGDGADPGAMKTAVCSPGGTTIAGVHALEEKAFRAAVMDAVAAGYKRALELRQ